MNQYQVTVETFNRLVQQYQDNYMELDLYNATYDLFCRYIQRERAAVLDVAFEPGNITKYLLAQRPRFKLLGIDLAPNMVELAQRNNPSAAFRVLDGRQLAAVGQRFDAIITEAVLPIRKNKRVNDSFRSGLPPYRSNAMRRSHTTNLQPIGDGMSQHSKRILNVTDDLALFFTSANGHHLLRALRPVTHDAVLHRFNAREFVTRPTYLSVQVADDRHIHLAPEFLQYINHSCAPNVFFDTTQGAVVALRDIAADEELTFFYPSTEWTMTQPFDCFCGARECLGAIQGAAHLHRDVLARYRFAEHIQRRLVNAAGKSWKTTRELTQRATTRRLVMPQLQPAF